MKKHPQKRVRSTKPDGPQLTISTDSSITKLSSKSSKLPKTSLSTASKTSLPKAVQEINAPKSESSKSIVGDQESVGNMSASSLDFYKQQLNEKLLDANVLKHFIEELGNARAVGCFCRPNQPCHVDVILAKLQEFLYPDMPPPIRVCVKLEFLQPMYSDLADWMQDSAHVLCTRRGRVFITDPNTNERYSFNYKESPWAN